MIRSILASALFGSLLVARAAQIPLGDYISRSTSKHHPTPSAPSAAERKALQQALLDAPSAVQREAVLFPNPPDASNITFQFVNNTVLAPTGGTINLAEVDEFPALLGTNVAMAIGFVNPCGLNVPHSHPRASEMLTVVQGELVAGLVLENDPGAAGRAVIDGQVPAENPKGPLTQVTAHLGLYRAMLFPQGEVHFQFNPTCEPAVFASAFDNLDPGRAQAAASFFTIMSDEVIMAALGEDAEFLDPRKIDLIRNNIPMAFAELIDSCAKKCGIASS